MFNLINMIMKLLRSVRSFLSFTIVATGRLAVPLAIDDRFYTLRSVLWCVGWDRRGTVRVLKLIRYIREELLIVLCTFVL